MRQSAKFRMIALALALSGLTAQAGEKPETRCGWYDNPTPANAWLRDKDGEWAISVQGGYRAEGNTLEFDIDDKKTFVHTNGGSYGYGCVCMSVVVDASRKRIREIKSFKIKKLSVCRADKKLKEPENPLQQK